MKNRNISVHCNTMKEYSKLKNYVAVQFTNSSHDVVPKHWISQSKPGKFRCAYPKNLRVVQGLSRTGADPDENWPITKVTILTHSGKEFPMLKINYTVQYLNTHWFEIIAVHLAV